MSRMVVYTDGACKHVGTSNAIAGAGVYFDKNDIRNHSCTVPGKQTNNRAELWAIIQGINMSPDVPLEIRSDSLWSIRCAQREWKANENLDLLNLLWELMAQRNVLLTWVPGHSGIVGNEEADNLAEIGIAIAKYEREQQQLHADKQNAAHKSSAS